MGKGRQVWISALETSADLHGSFLIRRLREMEPSLGLVGIGGRNMRSLSFRALLKAEDFSVMGLWEVVAYLPRIVGAYRRIARIFQREEMGAVVLIDAPDFHFKVASMAYKRGIPVIYYISPQVWAWRKGRIRFLKRYVSKLCCIFPFEKDFFARWGVEAEYVGHPLMEYLDFSSLDKMGRDKDSLVILPGSRVKEISSLLPEFSKTCDVINAHFPLRHIRLVVAPNIDPALIRSHWASSLPYEVVNFEKRYEAMAQSEFALVASGTASLECGLLKTPAVVAYRISLASYIMARIFVHINHISMTNIILGEGIFPEFIQRDVKAEKMSRPIVTWRNSPPSLREIKKRLSLLRESFGKKRASLETAKIVLQTLG